MPTYLYCIRSEPVGPAPGLTGIDGGIVRAMDVRGLRAWVSDVDGSIVPTVDRVKAHDAVCASALEAGDTPVPIRFGQTFADDAAAADAIIARERSLRSRLERVDGCVEMRVIVSRGRASHDEEETLVGPGTAFLHRLAREGQADLAREVGCEEIRHAVRTDARSLIIDNRPCESARGMAFFPVLVRRANVDAFRFAIVDAMPRDGIDLSVLGPFAPYSFAGDV